MSTTYRIAEVARRSGFKPTTLRYYEDIGLLSPPARTEAGYRVYDDDSLARLGFIARAKQLGCTLEEITELASAWEGERCAPVQARLRELVATKIADAQDRMAGLAALTTQLRHAVGVLAHHTPDGPCDDRCGCTADPVAVPAAPFACTLDPAERPGRVGAWQQLFAGVSSREPLEDGVRLTFAADVPVGEVTEIAAAEQRCCAFFGFTITVDERGTALEVRAPEEAQELLALLFDAPS